MFPRRTQRQIAFIMLVFGGVLYQSGLLPEFPDNKAEPMEVEMNATSTATVSPLLNGDKKLKSASVSPILNPEARPWFMTGGTVKPSPSPVVHSADGRRTKRIAKLWPEEDPSNDRIIAQLMFIPPDPEPWALSATSLASVNATVESGANSNEDDRAASRSPSQPTLKRDVFKRILMYNGHKDYEQWWGERNELSTGLCPVNTCTVTEDRAEATKADAIMFHHYFSHPGIQRPLNQIWIMHFMESPYHTPHIDFNDVFNWTATYRHDSDLAAPYNRWLYFDPLVRQKSLSEMQNYAANKTKKVAWFVSNCSARNNRRQYAAELSKYIQVDVYGACGSKNCPRAKETECFQMLQKDYKFYLAFENSNCKDYITEKLFVNALGHNVLPIVMGAHPEDYVRSAPENSYLHVDDFESPKTLAAHLHKLDKDDRLYNEFFRWKGNGEFVRTHFLCRLCAMLHDEYPVKRYRDVNEWWRGPGVCTDRTWQYRE